MRCLLFSRKLNCTVRDVFLVVFTTFKCVLPGNFSHDFPEIPLRGLGPYSPNDYTTGHAYMIAGPELLGTFVVVHF